MNNFLRKYAKDKKCLVRYPGCNSTTPDPTVILAHYRSPVTGMGQKEHDFLGAHCCHRCHEIADGRTAKPHGWTRAETELAFHEGMVRTQKKILDLIMVGSINPMSIFPAGNV